MASEQDGRIVGLTTLLQLTRDARHTESVTELGYLIANETRRLVPYRQAVFWEISDAGAIHITSASGTSEIENHSPYVVWLKQLLEQQQVSALHEPQVFTVNDVAEPVQESWSEFLAPHVILVPLLSSQGVLLGGFLLAADHGWDEGHLILLEQLADAYSHAWSALTAGKQKRSLREWFTRKRKIILLVSLVVLLFPVRQSVVAPASVSSRNPVVVAAPLSGVVEEIHVQPSEHVEQGTPLFSFDDTEINSEVEVAQKAMEVAQAEYRKNSQLAYACDECRSRLPVLQAQIAQKQADLRHALSRQERLTVRAEIDGTTIFQNRNELLGRPVSVGERIMLLAEPDDSWLEIHLPVEDAITLEEGADVRFFLNIDPLAAYDARLEQTSYEAEQTAQQVLAYTLMAGFAGDETPRLGLKGTARIYGSRVPFFYYVLRRPLAWVRLQLGW